MDSLEIKKFERDNSLEDFEFFDGEGDLDVDLSKSPIHGAAEKLSNGVGQIISALCVIVEEKGMIPSVPVKAVAATAVGAVTGSLIGGPPGLAIGLITGAVMAYRTSPSRSKIIKQEPEKSAIRQLFSQMTLKQKKELLKEMLGCLKQSNVRSLIVELIKNESIRGMALEILSGFLMKKMGVSLVKSKRMKIIARWHVKKKIQKRNSKELVNAWNDFRAHLSSSERVFEKGSYDSVSETIYYMCTRIIQSKMFPSLKTSRCNYFSTEKIEVLIVEV